MAQHTLGIRGATCADEDTPAAIHRATCELVGAIVGRNHVKADDIVSVIFTVTPDLTSAFPASTAREFGWRDVPLLCTTEIPVPGALPRCIRMLLHLESDRTRHEVQHVYLHAARQLRPDLA